MRYRKKPIVVDAVQWTGKNFKEIVEFVGGIENRQLLAFHQNDLHIKTLEDIDDSHTHKVDINDFIIKGIKGEFYQIKPDVFQETYERVE